jgi:uncharacterized protein YcaQ
MKTPALREVSRRFARRLWIDLQGLAKSDSFGRGKMAALEAVRRLGYVQIDTIFVVERAHHHILHSRVSDYRPSMLHELQTLDRTVFEYWTHALAFVPTEAYPFYMRQMRAHAREPSSWFRQVTAVQARAMLRRISSEGPISIRQIEEEKQEKDHEWASRKPSKRVLEHLFYTGRVAVNAREGMLKVYEKTERHFGWEKRPRSATLAEETSYRIERALRAQGLIDPDSATYLEKESKARVGRELEKRAKAGSLTRVRIEGLPGMYYAWSADLERTEDSLRPEEGNCSVLSPFDPLVIQRKRTKAFFGFDYTLECYVPAAKRRYGYFSLPILYEDRLVGRIDAKADRERKRLLIQSWHWEKGVSDRRALRPRIDSALARFESFQFAR